MKVLKFLIILILFPLGELLRFDIGNNIVLKPLDIVVGMTAIAWFIYHLLLLCHSRIRGRLHEVDSTLVVNPVDKNTFFQYKKEFLFFPLIGLLSLTINITWLKPNEFVTSFLYLARWIAYASLFLIVSKFDKPFKEKIKLFLLIDGLVILFLGFIQYFFFSSLKSFYYLGWDEHMYRKFSVFLDPNYAGAFFVLYFLFIAHLANFLAGSSLQLDPKCFVAGCKPAPAKNIRLLILTGFILLLTLIAIFLTFSRAALLMLIAGSFTYLFLIKRKKIILAVLGAIVVFAIIFSPKFNNENMNLLRQASIKARVANYSTAVKIIKSNPLLGVGFNTYRYAKEMYGIQIGWVNAPSHADAADITPLSPQNTQNTPIC